MHRLLGSRYEDGIAAVGVALVRVVAGFLFVSFSIDKFADHAAEAADFEHYGVPIPDVAVYAAGTALALNMVGAISTAGRVDGGSFHLGVAPALLAVMLMLLWVGSGKPALDAILVRRPNV